MTYALIAGIVRDEERVKSFHVLSQITVLMVLQNFLVIATVIIAHEALTHVVPSFRWSLYSLFRKKKSESREPVQQEGNIHFLAMDVMYFGPVYLILFAFNLPRLAVMEEEMFRQGTESWVDGVLRSICFGLAHCLVGVPISAGLAITIGGLWFTHQYFIGGVELSTIHHTTYNLIAVSVIFLILTRRQVAEFLKRRRKESMTG